MDENDPKRLAVQYAWYELVKKGGEALGIEPESGECVKLFQNFCQQNLHGLVDIGCGVKGKSAQLLDKKHSKKNDENLTKFKSEEVNVDNKETKDDTYSYRPFEAAFKKEK